MKKETKIDVNANKELDELLATETPEIEAEVETGKTFKTADPTEGYVAETKKEDEKVLATPVKIAKKVAEMTPFMTKINTLLNGSESVVLSGKRIVNGGVKFLIQAEENGRFRPTKAYMKDSLETIPGFLDRIDALEKTLKAENHKVVRIPIRSILMSYSEGKDMKTLKVIATVKGDAPSLIGTRVDVTIRKNEKGYVTFDIENGNTDDN